MNKSLTPLIIIFTIIIFLTIVILNSDLGEKPQKKKEDSAISREMNIQILRQDPEKELPRIAAELNFNVSKHLKKAKSQLAEKKESDAEDTLRTILVFEPENMNALSLLGGIFYYSGRYDEAEDIFKQQIKIDPNSYLAYNRLASTLAKQKKYDDAIKTTSKALSINPESPDVNINLAGMYSITGKKERALMHFRKAYEAFGYAILPLSLDSAFDNIRYTPEFQSIIAKAKKELPSKENIKGTQEQKPEQPKPEEK